MLYLKTVGAVRCAEVVSEEIRLSLYKMADVPNFIRLCFRVKSHGRWGPATPLAEVLLKNAQKMGIMFSRTIEDVGLTKKLAIPCAAGSTEIELFEENNQENRRIFKLL